MKIASATIDIRVLLPETRFDIDETGSIDPNKLFAAMSKTRSQELSEKAHDERRRCRDWLLPFMQENRPKFLTKNELRVAAMSELNVSKNSFDFAWMDAIETTGRHDWYEPLRRRPSTKS